MNAHIFPSKVIKILLSITAFITIMNTIVRAYGHYMKPKALFAWEIIRWFNTSDDQSLPTYFSIMLLTAATALLVAIAIAKAQQNDRFARHWKALAAIFFYLSLDEASTIHEMGSYFHPSWMHKYAFLKFSWVILGAILVVAVAASFVKFLVALPPKYRTLLIISGAIYVGGALGLEIVGNVLASHYGIHSVAYAIENIAEEMGEQLGASLFIYSLLTYMAAFVPNLQISIGNKDLRAI